MLFSEEDSRKSQKCFALDQQQHMLSVFQRSLKAMHTFFVVQKSFHIEKTAWIYPRVSFAHGKWFSSVAQCEGKTCPCHGMFTCINMIIETHVIQNVCFSVLTSFPFFSFSAKSCDRFCKYGSTAWIWPLWYSTLTSSAQHLPTWRVKDLYIGKICTCV